MGWSCLDSTGGGQGEVGEAAHGRVECAVTGCCTAGCTDAGEACSTGGTGSTEHDDTFLGDVLPKHSGSVTYAALKHTPGRPA